MGQPAGVPWGGGWLMASRFPPKASLPKPHCRGWAASGAKSGALQGIPWTCLFPPPTTYMHTHGVNTHRPSLLVHTHSQTSTIATR